MIQLTAFDGREVVLNALLVERIEAVPDTVVTLTTGNTYLVRESVHEVVRRSMDYLRSLHDPAGETNPAVMAQWGRVVK